MNTRKSWLLSFLLIGFLSITAFASANYELDPVSVNKQFHKFLKGMNLDIVETDETIYVDFMINEKSEIIVLSTSDKTLDKALKARLNYKVLESSELDLFKRYTVPISFKK